MSVVLEPAADFCRRLAFPGAVRLYARAVSLVPRDLDFGDIVAVLIVMIGLIPFASAGLWPSP